MAKKNINADLSELKEFVQRLENAANGDLRKQYGVWLEALGMEFLNTVQDEIIRLKVLDTRRLLNSFSRGDSDCVFEMDAEGLKLTIGTNVEYAGWVNDGHFAGSTKMFYNTKSGKRFMARNVKNLWYGQERWIEGYHYFDISISIFEKIMAASLEKKLNEWLKQL